jgi:MFS family permease
MACTGFRRLFWSNLAAQSAEQIGLAAVPIVAVLALGAGAAGTGFLSAAQTLPYLLLSLPFGLIADRARRRRLMAGAETARALALATLPVLAAFGLLSVPLLAVLGFAAATGTVAYSVAAPALLPNLVERGTLASANSKLELARSLAFAAGPALGGALVGYTGATAAFALAAILSATAACLLAGLPEPPRPATTRRRMLAELREGTSFTIRHSLLRPILFTAVAWNVSWFVLQAVFVPFAVHDLGMTAGGIGAALGAYGAGMVAGALIASRLARVISFGMLIASGPLVSVAAAALMLASLRLPSPMLPAASFFLFGAGPILWTIGQTTLRQTVTPSAMLGRVSALVTMATTGARPIGAALGGLVGTLIGLHAAIILAALGFVVQAAIILASPVPRLETLPEAVA